LLTSVSAIDRVDDALNRGEITPAEAEVLRQNGARDYAARLREVLDAKSKLTGVDQAYLDDLRDEIDFYDKLGRSISDSERFLKGFKSEVQSTGDIFERFGQNVSNAFGDVRNIFDGLKSAVRSFLNDLAGNALRNVVGSVLTPLAQIASMTGKGRSLRGLWDGGTGGFTTGGFAGGAGAGAIIGNSFASLGSSWVGHVNSMNFNAAVSNSLGDAFARLQSGMNGSAVNANLGISDRDTFSYQKAQEKVKDFLTVNQSQQLAGGSSGVQNPARMVLEKLTLKNFLGSLKSAFSNPFTGFSFGSMLGGRSTGGSILRGPRGAR